MIPTHDVDYFPGSHLNSVYRVAKNAAISCWLYKSAALGMKQAGMALRRAAGGPDPLDQIPALAQGESRRNVSASYYFLLKRYHRRDANYDLSQPGLTDAMAALERQGFEVGVHGSYTSLDEPSELAAQFDSMRARGFRPLGGRQHWLRFTLDRLIPAHCRSGRGKNRTGTTKWLSCCQSVGAMAGAASLCSGILPPSAEAGSPTQ